MSSIIEYIEKYGGCDFEEKPFNDVDGLILAQFSYLKFDGIVPGVGKDVEDIYMKDILNDSNYENLYADDRYAKNNRALIECMAASKRYGMMRLNYYINLISRRWEMQFSAIVCFVPGDIPVVVYRGTDESIIGWKEDFNMAYMTPIPAQIKAVDFMNFVSERIRGPFRVAGHSKGGNLAVYASMKSPGSIQSRINRIYSYDGPGFTKEALCDGDYLQIKSRVRKLVPKASLVGMLLQCQEEYSVVESKRIGILQHDPYNWVVDDDDFVHVDNVDELAIIQNKAINEWAQNTDSEEMRLFVNQMFDVVEAIGISDLNDFKGNYAEILKRFTLEIERLDENTKELMRAVFKSLFNIFIETVKNQAGISRIGE